MANVQGPLLSVSASKSIAGAITYKRARGRNHAQSYHVNAPDVAGSQATRQTNWTYVVSFWRDLLARPDARQAWNQLATAIRYRATGYHLGVAQMYGTLCQRDPATVAVEAHAFTGRKTLWYLRDIRTRVCGSEAGTYDLWAGVTPAQMFPAGEYPQSGGRLVTNALGDAGEIRYVQLVKNSLLRSGLYRITLEEDPTVPICEFDDVVIHGDLTVEGTFVGGTNYVNRGDPAGFDWTLTDFTTSGSWHELDCSAIVPAGATAIALWLNVQDNAAGSWWYFKKGGQVNLYNSAYGVTQVAGVDMPTQPVVFCDNNRVLKYKFQNTPFTKINALVTGWFI